MEYDITIQMAKERGRAPRAKEKTSGLLWLCLWEALHWLKGQELTCPMVLECHMKKKNLIKIHKLTKHPLDSGKGYGGQNVVRPQKKGSQAASCILRT